MWKQLAPLVYEKDWQTIRRVHPDVHASVADGGRAPSFLLGAAYTRFYMRPSCLANYFGLQDRGRRLLARFDDLVLARHERSRARAMAKGVTC